MTKRHAATAIALHSGTGSVNVASASGYGSAHVAMALAANPVRLLLSYGRQRDGKTRRHTTPASGVLTAI
jgi:hypothetical protein